MAEPPADIGSACSRGPALGGSDAELQCHLGVPQTVYYWHFPDGDHLTAAFTHLISNVGSVTPSYGTCQMQSNGKAVLTSGGVEVGFVACPDFPPNDIPYLYQGGSGPGFLTWVNYHSLTIGLASDPLLHPAKLFAWWQGEYRQLVASPL